MIRKKIGQGVMSVAELIMDNVQRMNEMELYYLVDLFVDDPRGTEIGEILLGMSIEEWLSEDSVEKIESSRWLNPWPEPEDE